VTTGIVASRSFGEADQTRFATFSGDWNPMHVDPVAARRTQAGAPVVHGIHTLLWCLDSIARANPDLPAIANLKMRADKMVYIGDTVSTVITGLDAKMVRADVLVEGAIALRLTLGFGPVGPAEAAIGGADITDVPQPIDLNLEAMAGMTGRLAFVGGAAEAAEMFPAASTMLGAERIAALACTTRLVGMVCPGLHSIFGGLTLKFCESDGSGRLGFSVKSVDPRFRMVRQTVSGGGIAGIVEGFARMPPTEQASLSGIADVVARDAYAGDVVLVIGGSRGIGEATAKIAAAGGAHVTVTYASGQTDANRVAEEIRQFGGHCDVLAYDARRPAASQLAGLMAAPTHVYYFATPSIGRRKRPIFDLRRFDEFLGFYVAGFYDLCQALYRPEQDLAMFYPSTVFVDDRPPELTEYGMAKAAGEQLCRDLPGAMPPLRVTISRLPRLATDQNASVLEIQTEAPLDVMLPLVRDMHART
jgi:hypothetical protein